jgi:hypothetical protein
MSLRPMLLVFLLGLTATAAAQAPAPATSAPMTPARDAAPPSTRPVNDTGPDARMCLEYPTLVQIIRCAEKYLPRRAAAAKA